MLLTEEIPSTLSDIGRTKLEDSVWDVSIGDYLIHCLEDYGVRHVFGIPGDYVLSFYSMLERSPLQLVGCTREDCAGFAADAYARLNGISAVCVTYCVGGLSLCNSIAGAYAESLDWCNAHAVECGRLVAKHIDMLSPEAVADSIAAAPLQAVPAPKARAELEFLFGRLLDSNPALIGGRMPPDDFYAGVAVPAAAAANPAAAAVGQEAGTGR